MKKQNLLLLVLFISLIVVFETAQQLFYIERFQLAEGVRFMELFQGQALRWGIWLLLAMVMYFLVQKLKTSRGFDRHQALWYVLIVISFVGLNIGVIAVISYLGSGQHLNLKLFLEEYLVFFTFQKTPLFTLAYIGFLWVISLQSQNQQLKVEVKKLSEIAEENESLYQQLSDQQKQTDLILTIKSGDKYQVVNIQDIEYIEADDYCANIYLTSGKKYVMRISLKALEEKLPNHFLRIHRKFIINTQFVITFSVGSRNLTLQSQTHLPVAKSKLKIARALFATEKIT